MGTGRAPIRRGRDGDRRDRSAESLRIVPQRPQGSGPVALTDRRGGMMAGVSNDVDLPPEGESVTATAVQSMTSRSLGYQVLLMSLCILY